MEKNILVRKMGLILAAFVFLLPVFFVPAASVNLYVAKVVLLATGLVAIFAIYLSSVLSTGTIEIPKAKFLLPIVLFVLVSIVSSALSGAISSSIVGTVFDLGTSGSIIMLVFAFFMTMMTVKNAGTANKVVYAFIFSAALLSLYALLVTVLGSIIPTSLAYRLPQFPAGGQIDTTIILGAAVIISLCALNMSEVPSKIKYTLYALIAFSLLFVGAAGFVPVILMLAIASMVFFVYILSWSVGQGRNLQNISENTNQELEQDRERKISLSSLAVLIASVILLLGGSSISGYLSKTLRIQNTEVRPSFQATMDLAVSAWKNNFAFGVGPNRFAEFWDQNKPIEVNQTQFWNLNFYSGSGFIPTLAITTGLLGPISILVFLAMYLLSGIKAIFAQNNANRSRYLATASFLVSLYLWVMLFLYSPGLVVLAMTFIFTGLFTGMLVPQGIVGIWKVNIFSNPRTNFLAVLSIVILIVLSVSGGYFVWERAIASTDYQNGMIEYQKGNIAGAKSFIGNSLKLAPSDVYWRGLAEISVADLGNLLGSIPDLKKMTDTDKAQMQYIISDAVNSAKAATQYDPGNFQNWFALGRVYELLAGQGLSGAVQSAQDSYAEAAKRSPQDPSVPLALARLDVIAGDSGGAKAEIGKALELKNNYIDAYYAMAQLQLASNDIAGAIKSVEAASIVDPTNSGLYFQLGLLKYNQKDYSGAAQALERATALIPDYANARYFLGLSYYELGRVQDAVSQFEGIEKTNPDNTEIKGIIANIKAGKDPLGSSPVQSPTTKNK